MPISHSGLLFWATL